MSFHPLTRIVSTLLLFPAAVLGQVAPSQVLGAVTDSSGAAVASARVALTSEARGFTSRTLTAQDGYYAFSNLIPGTYRLEVEQAGFRPFTQSGIVALAARSVRADIVLAVGNANESVTVSGDASLLETSTQEVGQTIDNRRVIGLPLNGRSYLELAPLAPNAIPFTTGTRQGTGFVLGGSRFNSNNLMVATTLRRRVRC